MKFKYGCVECEDTENFKKMHDHLHCDCGGHMVLVKEDHFSKIKGKCVRCYNMHSSKCVVCVWNGEDGA